MLSDGSKKISTSGEFGKLFEPLKIKDLELKNRLVMAPMVTLLAEDGGYVGERLINYYERRAKGNCALIIVEASYVTTLGGVMPNALCIYDDKYLKGLSRLVEKVKSHGSKIAIQLFHPGSQLSSRISGVQSVAPSEKRHIYREGPRALNKTEIEGIISSFGKAAARSVEAGFDAVEIHGAHGYLIHEFLSPLFNIRMDEYGGNLEKRARFALECVKSVRENVGLTYPIFFRISASDFLDNGLGVEEVLTISTWLEKAGVDVLDVSAGTYEKFHYIVPPVMRPKACNVELSKRIKEVVGIPVIVAGRINSPELAEDILKKNKADLIAMGRQFLSDPEFPIKAMKGRTDEIRKCVACNTCVDFLYGALSKHVLCMQNPEVGREKEWSFLPLVKRRKRVAVIGGGPGGMEAARISALRGHDVVLYEKEEKLGGKINLITRIPGKKEFEEMLYYYQRQMDLLKVNVVLGREMYADLLMEQKPDAVIVAVGSIPLKPDISGIESDRVVTADDVLVGRAEVGGQVVIIGGGLVGCDTALYLAERGKKVTILRRGRKIGKELGYSQKKLIIETLEDMNVRMVPGVAYRRIDNEGLYVEIEGEERLFEADSIVIAAGYQSNSSLYDKLNTVISAVFEIGDCQKPGYIIDAIHQAAEVARSI
ncbi:MAG: FAD-dependent oxidoreductase [Deltaproteobacteria bacterium]|nr:FAD-dependent oxidoreductase [Deltaproteobacteria bacterium]MBW2025447.1 FAD-dependent oxidoreductase [Deltaproteobacteria bacterium]MBW2126896.1 FAD-dependent oxidoreductase [Deltaproteobacteria bacterium]